MLEICIAWSSPYSPLEVREKMIDYWPGEKNNNYAFFFRGNKGKKRFFTFISVSIFSSFMVKNIFTIKPEQRLISVFKLYGKNIFTIKS